MNFKAEVVADGTGDYVGNGLVFATEQEADAYAIDLHWRWTAVRAFRIVPTDAPVNYRWNESTNSAVPLVEEPA